MGAYDVGLDVHSRDSVVVIQDEAGRILRRGMVAFLVALAAGNFFIAASDLVPEVDKHRDLTTDSVHFGAFLAGIVVLLVIKVAPPHEP